MADPIYIHGLKVADFLRIELVELEFRGPGLEIISGKNRSGKSSLINSIVAALGGKEAIPAQPVRKGEKRAEVMLDLGDRIVKLKIKPDRSTVLSVETKDGMQAKAPQKLLDDLVGATTLDPVSFMEMTPEKQAETLRKLVGLDVTKLDEDRKRLYDERTAVNRDLKMLEGQLAGMGTPEAPPALVEVSLPAEVDITELAKKQSAALMTKNTNDNKRREFEHHQGTQINLGSDIIRAEKDIERLQAELAKKKAVHKENDELLAAKAKEVLAFVDPDMTALSKELDLAKDHNANIAKMRSLAEQDKNRHEMRLAEHKTKLRAHEEKALEVKTKKSIVDGYTGKIDGIDKEKTAKLGEVKFPLEGLSVDGDAVIYGGIPLEQASSAEQLQVSLSIAAALNPRLKVLLVRQGNDLDSDRLKQVAEWAKNSGYQVLLEKVASDTPVGIVIESGKVGADLRLREPTVETGADDEPF